MQDHHEQVAFAEGGRKAQPRRGRRPSPRKKKGASVMPNDIVVFDDNSISDVSSLGTRNLGISVNKSRDGIQPNVDSIFRPRPTVQPKPMDEGVIKPKRLFPNDFEEIYADVFPEDDNELDKLKDALASTANGLDEYSPSYHSRRSLYSGIPSAVPNIPDKVGRPNASPHTTPQKPPRRPAIMPEEGDAELRKIHEAMMSTKDGLQKYSPQKKASIGSPTVLDRGEGESLFSYEAEEEDDLDVISYGPPVSHKAKQPARRGCTCYLIFVIVALIGFGGIGGFVVLVITGGGRVAVGTFPPTFAPSPRTTANPTPAPTLRQTGSPTIAPTPGPTFAPTTGEPTPVPSPQPTFRTTPIPTTGAPTTVHPTDLPSGSPTEMLSTVPTAFPTTASPTARPPLADLIAEISPESRVALDDPQSPQSLAVRLMENQTIATTNAPLDVDRFGLLSLFFSTNGKSSDQEWTNTWDLTTSTCAWYGVKCFGGKVVELNLAFNGLDGTLPNELSLLTDLESLVIAGSSSRELKGLLMGTIPHSWGRRLSNLRNLELYDNRLTGTLPPTLGQMVELRHLHLDGNEFFGDLDRALTGFGQLETLDLSGNAFVGTLPSPIMSMTSLVRLNLQGNWFYGSIPEEIGMLRHLQELQLQENSLQGNLPMTLTTMNNLVWLRLFKNQFSGEIPSTMGDLINLEGLELQHNRFRGTIPDSIPTMASLRILDVSYNFLTGSVNVFEQLGDSASALTKVLLHHNDLTGLVPFSLCESALQVSSDCNDQIQCDCCTECIIGSGR